MRTFEFVISIVALGMLFKLLHTRMTMKHEDKQRGQTDDAELRSQLSDLEQRLRVLERIVTDRKSNLHERFRDLGNE
jgi:hypothetical protein